jgi:hypothetical protein
LQAKPQVLALHVALPFAGAGQPAPQPPQLAGSLAVSTHEPPQGTGVGAVQPLEHVPPAHTAGAPQTRAHVPHVADAARSASQPLAVSPSQSAKPLAQLKPQLVPSHVAIAPSGALHGAQLAPHDDSEVFETHTSPHRWNPARQANPQLAPSHVESAFGGGAHGEQAAPQDAGEASETQASPQRWLPLVHVKSQLVPSHVATA